MSDIMTDESLWMIDENDPHYLFNVGVGLVRDEGTMFDIYRSLRTPIIKLERISG